jgi:hypothetical protein
VSHFLCVEFRLKCKTVGAREPRQHGACSVDFGALDSDLTLVSTEVSQHLGLKAKKNFLWMGQDRRYWLAKKKGEA